jgi:hypothetical protein
VQATKTKSERAQNIKRAFEVNRPYWVEENKFYWWMMYLQLAQRQMSQMSKQKH